MAVYLREHKGSWRPLLKAIPLALSAILFACAAVMYSRSRDVTPIEADDAGEIAIVFTASQLDAAARGADHAAATAYAASLREHTPHVALVDCGGASGGDLGAIKSGDAAVGAMNASGFTASVPSAGELALGYDRMAHVIKESRAAYISTSPLPPGGFKYRISEFGKRNVALIGATPIDGASAEICESIAASASEARQRGADAVVALVAPHHGDDPSLSPTSIASAAQGIDAYLCASDADRVTFVSDARGRRTLVATCRRDGASFGALIVTNGGIYASIISDGDAPAPDGADTSSARVDEGLKAELEHPAAWASSELPAHDLQTGRSSRASEVPVGQLCADALRNSTGADAAIVDGGRILNGLPAGDVTYADMIAVRPAGVGVLTASVPGELIVKALEYGVRNAQAPSSRPSSGGESQDFPQVSGIKFSVDTSVRSPVVLSPSEDFIDTSGRPRVTNVMIADSSGIYRDLDPSRTYTIAFPEGSRWSMLESEAGPRVMSELQALMTFVDGPLQGRLTQYAVPDRRIAVK